jgi:P-type E1-E2 ATPase
MRKQRAEIVEVIRNWPEAGPVLGPLYLRNSDWPGADEAADKLEKLATNIGYFGLFMGVSVFLTLTISFLVLKYPLYTGAFRAILNFFIMGITLIVVAVPEGLPLALTLTQLTVLKQMTKHHVIVKELVTCEQLGSVTAINSDKTASITAGTSTVWRLMAAVRLRPRGVSREPASPPSS